MTARAKYAFVSYAGGERRTFRRGDTIPADIADRLVAHTYEAIEASTVEVEPKSKPAKRAPRKRSKSD